VIDPAVRDAYERAIAVVTAVRQTDTPTALAVVADLDRDGVTQVLLAASVIACQVLNEWCTDEGVAEQADAVWAGWAQRCSSWWDRP
jgi:hypothetical protein